MKIDEIANLLEMPLKTGSLRNAADQFAIKAKTIFNKNDIIGEIEDFKVLKSLDSSNFFAMIHNDKLILIARLDTVPNQYTIVDDVWVDLDFSNKKVFSKFLWFLKSRLEIKKIALGNLHSEETVNLLKNGGLSRFEKYWFNSFTDERQSFNKDNLDEFYKSSKWKLILENDSVEWEGFPKFNSESWIQNNYDWQIL